MSFVGWVHADVGRFVAYPRVALWGPSPPLLGPARLSSRLSYGVLLFASRRTSARGGTCRRRPAQRSGARPRWWHARRRAACHREGPVSVAQAVRARRVPPSKLGQGTQPARREATPACSCSPTTPCHGPLGARLGSGHTRAPLPHHTRAILTYSARARLRQVRPRRGAGTDGGRVRALRRGW